ncbi:hypothetical protein J14TS2_34620 [Bacillus sp. J14TS2]|nr:hypothetical protein J14TS2_34620 [Bacillus sp. J14TS2]
MHFRTLIEILLIQIHDYTDVNRKRLTLHPVCRKIAMSFFFEHPIQTISVRKEKSLSILIDSFFGVCRKGEKEEEFCLKHRPMKATRKTNLNFS